MATNAQLVSLVSQREVLLSRIKDLADSLQRDSITVLEVKAAASSARRMSDRFDKIEEGIFDINATLPEENRVQTEDSAKIFSHYVDFIQRLDFANQDIPQPERVASVKPLDLPMCNSENFAIFWEIFTNVYDSNPQMTPVVKYYYLMNHLSKDLQNLISEYLPVSEENYEAAKSALLTNFDNPRAKVTKLLSEMLGTPQIGNRYSSDDLAATVKLFKNSITAIDQLNLSDLPNVIYFQILYSKLDKSLMKSFDASRASLREVCTVQDLISFLQDRIQIQRLCHMSELKVKSEHPTASVQDNANKSRQYKSGSSKPASPVGSPDPVEKVSRPPRKTCLFCPSSEHLVYRCEGFLKLPVPQRVKVIQNKNLCVGCFSSSHAIANCTSQKSCKSCQSKLHNSLLCSEDKKKSSPEVSSSSDSKEPKSGSSNFLSCISPTNQTLLATAIVMITDFSGRKLPFRALLDGGSHLNFVTSQVAQILGLKREQDHTIINGITGSQKAKGKVSLQMTPRNDFSLQYSVNALILPTICRPLPNEEFKTDIPNVINSDALADPDFWKTSEIHILLGASVLAALQSNARPLIRFGDLLAQYTSLGYCIYGSANGSNDTPTSLMAIDDDLNENVKRYFEFEESSFEKPSNPDDKYVEEIFDTTTYRDSNGKFVVRLPFKKNAVALEQNKYSALTAYKRLEEKLSNQPEIAIAYNQFFEDYVQEGMMVPAETHVDYMLVHHPVTKTHNNVLKVRPVFNGSALDRNNNSLNSQLLKGPKLYSDIFSVLLSFRMHPVPVACDIKRMYNCLVLNPADRRFQHMYWRRKPEEEIKEWVLTCVIFGLTPSGYLAQKAIEKLAEEDGDMYPIAKQILLRQRYVDDIVYSCQSQQEALEAKRQLIDLLQRGGFELRKFVSSDPVILDDIPLEHRDVVDFNNDSDFVKILGLAWSPKEDYFLYNIFPFSGTISKREILSYLARVYDVTGFVTPVTLAIKLFLRKLWLLKFDWDATLPDELNAEWSSFSSELTKLQELRIPRYVPVHECQNLELVGFSDGSSVAFGAAIYLRCEFPTHAELHLIKAKARPNSLKPVTIPRVELQAATMLAELYESLLTRIQDLPISNTYFCTDSTIVLAWLRTPPHNLKTFVANRVLKILSNTKIESWKHVPSASNAADPASRSLSPSGLLQSEIWWHGPQFLREVHIQWPSEKLCQDKILPEIKPVSMLAQEEKPYFIDKFSSLYRLKIVTALCFRFAYNCQAKKKNHPKMHGPVSVQELQKAMSGLIHWTQREYFPTIQAGGKIPKVYRKLTPYVEKSTGLIRVGGRLDKAPLPFQTRHPFLLPQSAHLSSLILNEVHIMTLHGGLNVTKATTLLKYWITGLTSISKKTILKCVKCRKFQVKPPEPLMAELPGDRFRQERAFLISSTDFCGPFSVHESPRPRSKIIKAWVCLFTCLSTRASHLEVVFSLSTEAFLAALDRFTSRRGLCQKLYSDCGTNYKGAAAELVEVKDFLLQSKSDIERELAKRQIVSCFMPPASPFKNGISESLIKVFKRHLWKVAGDKRLTVTEFITLVTRIEAVMNSRPLIPLQVDPQGILLTPGHFLIGDSMLSVPEIDLTDTKTNRLSRYQVVKQSLQQFWKTWRYSYLQTLMERSKWNDNVPNLKVGDVVYIKHEDTPPHLYPLAVIDEFLTHSDGVSRVAKVRTSGGTLVRPVQKLIPLNISSAESDS